MIRLSTIALFTTFALAPAVCADMFVVDLQGTDGGHTLQVMGTIDVNLLTDTVTGSDLKFFHESDPAVQLPNIPTGSGVDFVVDMDMLFIEMGATTHSSLTWSTNSSGFSQSFELSQSPGLFSTAFSISHIQPLDVHLITNSPSGARLKVGTAVPEPSAFMFLSLVGLVGLGGRWWRKRRTQISSTHS